MSNEWDLPSSNLFEIDSNVRAHIASVLQEVARERGVRVLYAAESGSRAWGFGSPDSDYDVRFIYAHEAVWYVGLEAGRDVIERPLDPLLVDLAGWDVRKALRLLLKSNPALYEWLVSPIVYADDGAFRAGARRLFEEHASPRALAAHYWSIARGQWNREVDGRDEVKLKKYFYVIRPLLSLQSVVDNGVPPPMQIEELLARATLGVTVRGAIADLLVAKRDKPELGRGKRIAVIDDWAVDALAKLAPERLDLSELSRQDGRVAAGQLFRNIIGLGQL